MEMHELRSTVEHDFAVDSDGTVHALRIRVVQGEGIIVWAGEFAPGAKDKTAVEIEASDFLKRTVVHFVSWKSVQDFYDDTRFAPLLDSIRSRTLRFSTVQATGFAVEK